MTHKSLALTAAAMLGSIAIAVVACQQVQQAVTKFEQRAAPVVANGCAVFHAAEVNPLVQLALAAGSTAATAASGVPVGTIVGTIRSFGDQFCALGPPPGDTSTAQEQASWIVGVAAKLLASVGVAPAP